TFGAYQTNPGGGGQDGVIFKLNTDLSSILWSTYLGGTNVDAAFSIKTDRNGFVFVCGGTASPNLFPANTPGWLQFYRGGTADGYIARLTPNGSSLTAATYIGTNLYDQAFFVQLDSSDNVYITGQTEGNYPILNAGYSVANGGQFITKLTNDLSVPMVSSRYGSANGIINITINAFLVDRCGNIYISGWGGLSGANGSTNGLPVTANAIQTTTDGRDFYLAVFGADMSSLRYATFIGAVQTQQFAWATEHVDGGTSRFDKRGVVYQAVCGGCGGNSFPTTPGAYEENNGSSNCNNVVFKLDFELMVPTQANFSYSLQPLQGCSPLQISFTNLSNGGTFFFWNLGNGNTSNAFVPPPQIYTQPGDYTVMLIISDNDACTYDDTISQQISVLPNIYLDFGFTVNPCEKTVVFHNYSTNVVNGLWYFGDGTSSTQISPTHQYANYGTYQVMFIGNNATYCPDTIIKTVTLIEPNANFNPITIPCVPTVQFQNTGWGGSYRWTFGD
ncbi:MAG: PKD domain-containing protein, partial [Bacteroidia bacterium]|nr:PKD domain-containing protein [Bacteroidia bacterium]